MLGAGWRRVAVVLAAVVGFAGAPLVGSPASAHPAGAAAVVDSRVTGATTANVDVIVQKDSASDHGPEAAIEHLGGTVTRDLSIVDGFAATIPTSATGELSSLDGIRAVTLDEKMQPTGLLGGGGGGNSQAALKSVAPQEMQADDMWRAGYTGQGVTVAVIDTGIANVPDLAGRIVPVKNDLNLLQAPQPCLNLSGEPDCTDNHGHGTFVAGLIAGNGASSNGAWKGIAPSANVLSVKVAGRDGSADVSNVLAAIQWVVSFKDRYGIKVVNLSLGTDSTQSYTVDPLNFAVEKAWDSGITVVVAASNRGPDAQTISKPGDDPLVITVGAVDDMGTPGLGDDELPDFSSHGPTAADGLAKPDVVAPGAHIVSLRAPGSDVDVQFPTYVDGAYRKGSGTSFSTGEVSGAVALLNQANPSWTPDRIKFALMATAHNVASTDAMAVGAGIVDVNSARTATAGLANQGVARSNGLGSLDLSRGSVLVTLNDPMGTLVSGTLTAQNLLWNPLVYTLGLWNPITWYTTDAAGSRWYGSRWYGSRWYGEVDGSRWYGSRWYGQATGSRWYGSRWYGSAWYGAWE
ncbi:MAG: S8 family peptidase [Actinobacteria bacterium]|nr:S8 family peptidase [Actinomycetota bacterium]